MFFPSERLTHCNRPGLAGTRVSYSQELWRTGWCRKAAGLGPCCVFSGSAVSIKFLGRPRPHVVDPRPHHLPAQAHQLVVGQVPLYQFILMTQWYRRIHRPQALRLRLPGLRFPPCRWLAVGQSGPFTQLSLCPLMCKMRVVKNPPANAKDTRSILGPERFHMPRGK